MKNVYPYLKFVLFSVFIRFACLILLLFSTSTLHKNTVNSEIIPQPPTTMRGLITGSCHYPRKYTINA
jgi:hypothetical protein